MNTTQTPVRPSPWKRLHFMAPLVFVNLLALIGQSIWTKHKLSEVFLSKHAVIALLFAILMGMTLESIGTYLSLQAHAAVMDDQASGGLRLAAYAIGAVMAALNFTHFSTAPVNSTSLGIMFALASLCSPWLWSVESKAAHRAYLASRGVVDPRGVKLSTVRKIFHPGRSFKVMRWAAWAGEMDPARAVQGWESATQSKPQSGQTPQVTATIEVAQPAPVQVASLPQSAPTPAIESAPVPPVQAVTESTDESVTETVTETVTRTRTQTRSRTEARIQTLTERVESGTELTYDQIGSIIERTGRDVIKPVYLVLYRGQSVESVILGRGA